MHGHEDRQWSIYKFGHQVVHLKRVTWRDTGCVSCARAPPSVLAHIRGEKGMDSHRVCLVDEHHLLGIHVVKVPLAVGVRAHHSRVVDANVDMGDNLANMSSPDLVGDRNSPIYLRVRSEGYQGG